VRTVPAPFICPRKKKVDEGMVTVVNVKTDYRARATTVRFPDCET